MLTKMNNSTNGWYDHIHKSPLTPPSNVFGIVWPILYTLMLISLVLLIMNRTRNTPLMTRCYVVFGIQLVFNILWPIIFFDKREIHWGLADLILTDIFTIVTIYFFHKVYPISSYLLIPYMLWISFATYLNLYIVIKN